jgi:glyoxylase-like metal-dependent hydrolase (beta-lactamase superfamily II)
MKAKILKCAEMSPLFPRWHVAAPCILLAGDDGLVVVDTGLGLHDYLSPSTLVRLFQIDLGIEKDCRQALVRRVEALGHAPESISHIVLTHLHFDHAGGLPDFPHAKIHVHRREVEDIRNPKHWMALAYDRSDFAHGPDWVLYDRVDAEWKGFDAIRLSMKEEIYLIPLFGHTRGHCGVAARDGDGWLFQCGDALPTNAEFDLTPDWLNRLAIGPHVPRIRAWSAAHPEVRILAGHMWSAFFEELPTTR